MKTPFFTVGNHSRPDECTVLRAAHPDGRTVRVWTNKSLDRFVVEFLNENDHHAITLSLEAAISLCHLLAHSVQEPSENIIQKRN